MYELQSLQFTELQMLQIVMVMLQMLMAMLQILIVMLQMLQTLMVILQMVMVRLQMLMVMLPMSIVMIQILQNAPGQALNAHGNAHLCMVWWGRGWVGLSARHKWKNYGKQGQGNQCRTPGVKFWAKTVVPVL